MSIVLEDLNVLLTIICWL